MDVAVVLDPPLVDCARLHQFTYHKALHLGCGSSPRSVFEFHIIIAVWGQPGTESKHSNTHVIRVFMGERKLFELHELPGYMIFAVWPNFTKINRLDK